MQKQRHIQDEDTFFISQENNLIHFLRILSVPIPTHFAIEEKAIALKTCYALMLQAVMNYYALVGNTTE